MSIQTLNKSAHSIFKSGGVFVPSPLALDEDLQHHEGYQRLLTLYYIRSGAKAVIPGAHTGEFALNDLTILDKWLLWTKEMTRQFGENMVLLAMVGGNNLMAQVDLAIKHEYDAVMVAPTAFATLNESDIIKLFETVSSGIPVFAFELQRAIPGSYKYSLDLWSAIFEITFGAKGASFDTYRSLVMLEAAAKSHRKNELVLFTGNDDRIVADLLGEYSFRLNQTVSSVSYDGGLLGHFATDTRAAVQWVKAIQLHRAHGSWDFDMSELELAHGVNRCNMSLFDALGSFENSVWGVKYRLASMGLLPGPYCIHEHGRVGQAQAIDTVYDEYPMLSDHLFVQNSLRDLKREVGF